ncbi:MAG: TfoX/Sxy family protein [Endomicrobium sp.]|jgi:TfoX/Sxy family transcriptional regulator of competence genes|nr:TfoX/Sxy family protein [Endomicrobium sp.]
MATTLDFIEYVCGQIAGVGNIRYKKMFGEYLVYVNEKPILLVCDNTVFVKIAPCLSDIMRASGKGFPYKGAKEHYILDIDDIELAKRAADVLEKNTPIEPLKKKKKTKANILNEKSGRIYA